MLRPGPARATFVKDFSKDSAPGVTQAMPIAELVESQARAKGKKSISVLAGRHLNRLGQKVPHLEQRTAERPRHTIATWLVMVAPKP
jgi:hypothetical protein